MMHSSRQVLWTMALASRVSLTRSHSDSAAKPCLRSSQRAPAGHDRVQAAPEELARRSLAKLPPKRSAIALGSNLGDSRTTLENALKTLAKTPGITLQARSSWYQTAPVGPPQPDYLNGCAVLNVQLTPQELLESLLRTETKFGRVRQERNGPRTLDLDLLLFEDLILDTPNLQLPHPRMKERAFVLVPLAEIAPDWIEPVSGKAIAQLVQRVDCSGVRKL